MANMAMEDIEQRPVSGPGRYTRSFANSAIMYNVPKCKTSTYQRSFFVRAIRTWNALACENDFSGNNLNSFKSVLKSYYHASLEATYDPDNPRTFKTICCKCNITRSLKYPITCCF